MAARRVLDRACQTLDRGGQAGLDRRMKRLGCALLVLLAAGAARADGTSPRPRPEGEIRPQRPEGEIWYVILAQGGTSIGHASEETVLTAEGREVIAGQEIDVAGVDGPLKAAELSPIPKGADIVVRSVMREDKDGKVLSISSYTTIGQDWSRKEARIGAGEAEISRETPSEKRSVAVALPEGTVFDDGEALIAAWSPARAPHLEFLSFNIDAMAVDRVTLDVMPGAPSDGRTAVLRKRYAGKELMAASRVLIGLDGRIDEVEQPMFGTSVTIKRTDRTTALGPHIAYRALPSLMTKSPFLISHAAMKSHIRYRFSFRDGIEFALPETGEQRARAEPGFVTLDICADCGPGMASDPAALADALRSTAWLQADHPRLKAIADPIARQKVSDARKMELLKGAAWPYLRRIEFSGHYSALETLDRKAGDCTEAAVLLAALGRSAGIPTKVVNGLVYSRESYHGVSNVFMPHSWTLAFVDGRWKSFDLALDSFDSTHIALTIGDGDDRSISAAGQLAGLLHWESMAEVRTAPSPAAK